MRVVSDRRAANPLRGRSFLLMLLAVLGGFAGYVLLLPVVPLWAVVGGAGEIAAGATNAVFMLVTVLTQLAMPWLLRRVGHRVALGAGTLLIGLPTPLFAVSKEMWALLAVSGLRGIGFGLLTVAGSALVAELVPVAVRGRAAGLYGLSVGLPNVVFLPAGVWLAQNIGFVPLFWIAAALPVAMTAAVFWIAPVRRPEAGPAAARTFPVTLLSPWLVMCVVATAAGGLVAFLPLAITAWAVTPALLAFGLATVAGRWLAGQVGDRFGGRLVVVPSVVLAGVGTAAIALASAGATAVAVAGAFALGAGFGAVQNVTLVMMFERADSGAASTAWNIAYDAGNGIGAVGFGVLVTATDYPTTFGTMAAVVLVFTSLAIVDQRGKARSR
ncbi:MFS transporter [Saccharopolyspora erythraea]|uniref:MFS transporter n=1 Tax=Saccharopolyspora erythraea TaxID=1836 RepID=UPI001BAC6432|nr:MFS transporter [Saccharopolyspora erythraea]QUH04755.1 MFS transporter [Saccharopolyspora erythraea]